MDFETKLTKLVETISTQCGKVTYGRIDYRFSKRVTDLAGFEQLVRGASRDLRLPPQPGFGGKKFGVPLEPVDNLREFYLHHGDTDLVVMVERSGKVVVSHC